MIDDELVNGTELAARIFVTKALISRARKEGKLVSCTVGKKYYFRQACLILGRDPDNIVQSEKSLRQEKQPKKKYISKNKEKDILDTRKLEEEDLKIDIKIDNIIKTKKESATLEKYVLSQIQNAIIDKDKKNDRALLDRTKIKMQLLKEYHMTEQEKLKTKKLEGNLFSREEVIEILSFSMILFRNSLVNTANNYAVNLEGMNQKQIKDFVADDMNHILIELGKTSEKFIKG